MLPDRTAAPLSVAACPGSLVGGEIGPGPGVYRLDASPQGTPAIRSWILEEWLEWLRDRNIHFPLLPVDPVEVSEVTEYQKKRIWTEPRVGSRYSGRYEPWPINHAMVMIGRWRTPYRARTALIREKRLLKFWHRNSLPMYLIRGSIRQRPQGLGKHSIDRMIHCYQFFSRSNEAPLPFLQDVYHARSILPALKQHRAPSSFTKSEFCHVLRHQLSDSEAKREGLPQEPLSRVGRWFVHQQRVLGVPHDRVVDHVAAKLRPRIGVGRKDWKFQVLRKTFEPEWMAGRCVYGERAKKQLMELFAVFACAPASWSEALSKDLARYVLPLPADVFDDGLCRGIRHYCRQHLQRTVLNRHLEFLWEQYELARGWIEHYFEDTA